MVGVLKDTRVIDFGQYVAGPMAGMLLADQGADVRELLEEHGLGGEFDRLVSSGVILTEGVAAG